MNKYLVGFGDSWAAGSGLDFSNNQKAYITIAAETLGLNCYNCAIPGTGTPHLIVQLKKFISQHYRQQQIYHAVFFLTAMERDIYFDQNGVAQEIVAGNNRFANYYTEIYSDRLAIFKLNTILLSLHQLCVHYGINDHYIFGWQTPELWSEIDRSGFWRNGQASVLDLFMDIYPTQPRNIIHLKNMDHPWMIKKTQTKDSSAGHPNQLGHEKISQTVVDWLRPCI